MAEAKNVDTLDKLVRLRHLRELAEKIKANYATKVELAKELDKKADKDVLKKELTAEFQKYATKDELTKQISTVYKPKGSKIFSDLLILSRSAETLGDVYNVTDEFVTDDKFIEGVGHSYGAGTNVVVVQDDNSEYKFDVLGGIVDLDPYATTEELDTKLKGYVTEENLRTGLTDKFATKAEKEHTHEIADIIDVDVVTDDEVFNMLGEVFGLLPEASVMNQGETISSLGEKPVSDLISPDTSIDEEGNVTGTLKHIDGWTQFSGTESEQSGNFFPVLLDSIYDKTPITVTKDQNDPKTATDREWILRVPKQSTQFKFEAGESDGKKELFTLKFTDATLEQESE